MLIKLIKNEWKSIYKLGLIMVITTLLVGLIGMLTSLLLFNEKLLSRSDSYMGVAVLFAMMMVFTLILLMGGMWAGINIFLGVRFYKSMYSDEGYLTHTLPVGSHKLLISKVLVGGIWNLLLSLSMAVAVFLFTMGIVSAVDSSVTAMDILESIGGLFYRAVKLIDFNSWVHVILMSIAYLISPFFSLMILFGGISMGQLVKKYRAIMGVVFFVLVLVGGNIIKSILGLPVQMVLLGSDNSEWYTYFTIYYNLFYWIVIGAVMYWVAYLINEKKLNLE